MGEKKTCVFKPQGGFLPCVCDTPSPSDVESPVRANFPDGYLGEIRIQILVERKPRKKNRKKKFKEFKKFKHRPCYKRMAIKK